MARLPPSAWSVFLHCYAGDVPPRNRRLYQLSHVQRHPQRAAHNILDLPLYSMLQRNVKDLILPLAHCQMMTLSGSRPASGTGVARGIRLFFEIKRSQPLSTTIQTKATTVSPDNHVRSHVAKHSCVSPHPDNGRNVHVFLVTALTEEVRRPTEDARSSACKCRRILAASSRGDLAFTLLALWTPLSVHITVAVAQLMKGRC